MVMSSGTRRSMNLELNSSDLQRSRTFSLSDLVFDELLSPMKTTGNCRNVTPVSMTPTPTQFLFPTSVTAEQEAYASGFAQALEAIYRSEGQALNQPKMISSNNFASVNDARVSTCTSSNIASPRFASLNTVTTRLNSFSCLPSYSLAPTAICSNVIWPADKAESGVQNELLPAAVLPDLPSAHLRSSSFAMHPATAASSSIFEHQTSVTQSGNSGNWFHTMVPPPLSVSSSASVNNCSMLTAAADSTMTGHPTKLDMDEQDQWRLERKRAKNRVAAARCQMRKVERISRLQDRVQQLRDNNARLAQTASELTNHVSALRKQILMHTERGCRMMIPALS